MPPLVRSVSYSEGVALIDAWINNVISAEYDGAGCR